MREEKQMKFSQGNYSFFFIDFSSFILHECRIITLLLFKHFTPYDAYTTFYCIKSDEYQICGCIGSSLVSMGAYRGRQGLVWITHIGSRVDVRL